MPMAESPTPADLASAALFGDYAWHADANPAASALLGEPNPFGKPRQFDRYSRAFADNLLLKRLGVKCEYERGVALDKIYKFTPAGGYSKLPVRIATGQLDAPIAARGAAIVAAMTPRYRKHRLAMLRPLIPTSQIHDVETENDPA
jgi:hypothetical protein